MADTPSIVALIPARAGSKRVPDKNIRILSGHPLLAYTIAAARESGIFKDIIVSTDSEKYADIAQYYGAEVPFLRPPELAGDLSPDFDWVYYTLTRLKDKGRTWDCFSILRPTSPLRSARTIQRAWGEFLTAGEIDSLRAVEKCSQHPGKMWSILGRRMHPLLKMEINGQPGHSLPYQALPEVFVQNASLEIAWCRVVFNDHTIAGKTLAPFLTLGFEGVDINRPFDWAFAEEALKNKEAALPKIDIKPYPAEGK
jgi:CMP-N,N'-diacetyllegionaminic acid synthase